MSTPILPHLSPPELEFSRFLSPETQALLAQSKNWTWITSFTSDAVAPLCDPAFDAYLSDNANFHRPNHRRARLALEGDRLYTAHRRVYRCQPGVVILFDRQEESQWGGHGPIRKLSTPQLSRAVWLHFRQAPDSLTYEIRTNRNQHELPMTVKSGPMITSINQAWDRCVATQGEPLTWCYLQTLLMSCFLEILGTSSTEPVPTRHQQIIQFMQEYIYHHLAEPLPLEKLASLAGYSPSFFHQLFRRYTGLTPQEYHHRVRLHRAEQLLRENYTVEAISEQLGMSSAAHFRRFFKARMRLTPAVWRKMEVAQGGSALGAGSPLPEGN